MTERQVRAFLAAKLYEAGKLSFGKAAEMAGYTKGTFMELLADFGVDYFQMTEQDLESDLANAKRNLVKKMQNRAKILALAGSWNDMADSDFQEYLSETKNAAIKSKF